MDSLIVVAMPMPSLPPYYLEIMLSGRVAHADAVMVYRGRFF